MRENVRDTIITNSVPVMELVCESEAPQAELIGAGGTLREPTRSYVGPQAVHVLLVDGSKFARPALSAIAPVTYFGLVLAADVPSRARRAPARRGVEVQARLSIVM